jgi:hypothetical protein
MDGLPNDIHWLIWKQIGSRFLCLNGKQVCSRWNQVLSSDRFWQYYLDTKENPTSKGWQWYALSKCTIQPYLTQKDPNWVVVGKFVGTNYSYEGEIVNSSAHGYGSQIFFRANGKIASKYIGNFVDGRSDGYGISYDHENNELYQGMHTKGLHDGYGLVIPNLMECHRVEMFYCERIDTVRVSIYYLWQDGRSYEGHINKEGRFQAENYGVHIWPDGSCYEGNWHEMKRHGHGKMTWHDGNSWEGEWLNDQKINCYLNNKRWDDFFLGSFSEMYQNVRNTLSF